MSVCPSCRMALRQSLRRQIRQPRNTCLLSTKAPSTASKILAEPTWSIKSLLSPSSSSSETANKASQTTTSERPPSGPGPEDITPSKLRHLLRLAALPQPKSPEEETTMIETLRSQLEFVRAVQRVDTRGVEPLRAIRDETEQWRKENTIGLDDLKHVLEKETLVGHYKRPKRVKEKIESEAENWNVMGNASRKAGRYFVVKSGKDNAETAG